jgi:hypothetical protein
MGSRWIRAGAGGVAALLAVSVPSACTRDDAGAGSTEKLRIAYTAAVGAPAPSTDDVAAASRQFAGSTMAALRIP